MYISRAESRKFDERAIIEYGMPGLLLMENAARGCVDVLLKLGIQGPVCICCGPGNNGGDGFAMARRLDLLGISVSVIVICPLTRITGDAAINHHILSRSDVPIFEWDLNSSNANLESNLLGSEWIVDALLGTGFQGPLRQPFGDAIQAINKTQARRFAVDLPSGLDCDSGNPAEPTILAEHTCTFVAAKIGFTNPLAKKFLGTVHVVDIGAPRKLYETLAPPRCGR